MEDKRYVHCTLEETTAKRDQLKDVVVPDFVGVEGNAIIRDSRVCLCLKDQPDCVHLRYRPCKGCVPCLSDPPRYLECTMSAYCGVWQCVHRDKTLNHKKKNKPYAGPKRMVVPLAFLLAAF